MTILAKNNTETMAPTLGHNVLICTYHAGHHVRISWPITLYRIDRLAWETKPSGQMSIWRLSKL